MSHDEQTLPAGASIVEALLGLGVPARVRGILRDPQLRSLRATGEFGAPRTLTGAWLVIHLESDANGDVRGLLSREGDLGFEVAAGELLDGRVVSAVAVPVTAAAVPAPSAGAPVPAASAPAPTPPAAPPAAMAPAPPAPAVQPAPPVAPPPVPPDRSSAPGLLEVGDRGPMPLRPPTKKTNETEQPTPDPGALVEHFAFGRCEVVKSDGDRLHLKLGRDSRIKEIALEMLRVTRIGDENGVPVFRLDRKM
jgi:hypothetical protein